MVVGGLPWVRVEPKPPSHLIVRVRTSIVVRARPAGRVVERMGARTEFGSARALGVVDTRRGRWLAVSLPQLGNGRLGWVDSRAGGLRYARTRLELDVDLSARTLVLRRDAQTIRRIRVGIGRAASPTPTGRFAVTDVLRGRSFSRYYGCCILALSATQPHVPAGWGGGNRIAIHGTLSHSGLGRAVSSGCLHAADADLRDLMRVVPVGAPVVIRR
jgi:L,D-transpeptidase catalytic domain